MRVAALQDKRLRRLGHALHGQRRFTRRQSLLAQLSGTRPQLCVPLPVLVAEMFLKLFAKDGRALIPFGFSLVLGAHLGDAAPLDRLLLFADCFASTSRAWCSAETWAPPMSVWFHVN